MTERISCDVLVVGGGPAGLSAALAAARCGAAVVLLEKYGFLGGQATAGRVGTICGLPPKPETVTTPLASIDFVREWTNSLAEACGTRIIEMPGRLQVLPYDPWAFLRLADERAAGASDLTLLLHATLAGITTESDRVVRGEAIVWDRSISIDAKAMIDCTGCATAVHLAGGDIIEEKAGQPPGVVFSMDSVAEDLEELSGRLAALRDVSRAADEGRLPPECGAVSFLPPSPGAGKDRTSHHRIDIKLPLLRRQEPTFGRHLTQLELHARRLVERLSGFLVDQVPAFAGARLGPVAVQVGIRSGRRVRGRATLRESDVLRCRKFEDGVAWGTWPIEQWGPDGKPHLTHLPDGEYYEIPLGCLRAADFENVYVAGRCLSAESRALASARVVGTAMSTGWAAGTAAAFQSSGRALSAAVRNLRGDTIESSR